MAKGEIVDMLTKSQDKLNESINHLRSARNETWAHMLKLEANEITQLGDQMITMHNRLRDIIEQAWQY